MADRFPLILNTSINQIQEIASGDQLDLSGNNIANAGIITATSFSGDGSGLIGVASTDNIITGTAATFNNNVTFNSGTTFNGTALFTQPLDVNSDIDVDGHTNLDNVSVAGVSTFAGNADFSSGIDVTGNINATGTLGSDNITITSTTPTINFVDTNTNPDFRIVRSANGLFIQDTTNGNADRFQIKNDGTVFIAGDLDVDGHTNLDNVSVAGVTTIGGQFTVNANNNGANVKFINDTHNAKFYLISEGANKNSQIFFGDAADDDIGSIDYDHANNSLLFVTNTSTRMTIDNGGTVDIGGNLDVGAGIDVTGNVIASGNVTAVDGTFSGNVSVGGTLTYEDVTNVDSIGIITARSDIKVGSAITLTSAGAGFYAGIVTASNFVKRDGTPVGGVVSDSDGNTIAGSNAGANFTSGQALNNTLFGLNAGNDITTGDLNVAVGKDTLDACNTGRFNTAVGGSALGGIQGGSENTAVGYQAGLAAGSGNMTKNVFMGYSAGQSITSDENTVIGYEAGKANNTSGSLVAFGFEAAHNSQNAGRFTAIGYRAGKGHTGGNGNTYVGYQAGYLNGAGDFNCVMGDNAVNGSSDFNRATVFGAGAGQGFGSNANYNTVVGYGAASSTLTGDNNTIIGNGANASGNVSNEITLGNASVTRFRIPGIGVDLTGPIGITTEQVTPSSNVATLNLAKDDHKIVASGTYTIDVSGGTEAGSHTLRIENSGTANVGFSTYFKFPSGGTPSLPTTSGAISLISFQVHKVGSVGIATVLLAGASVNFS